jgi:hypothetical protein
MSDQIPIPTGVVFGLPAVAIDEQALARFSTAMAERLEDFEQRFAEPRRHPATSFGESRGANRRRT